MARKFNGSTDHMQSSTALATAIPVTFFGITKAAIAQASRFILVGNSSADTEHIGVGLDQTGATGAIVMSTYSGGNGNQAAGNTTTGTTWQAWVGASSASNNRFIWLEGGTKSTGTGGITFPVSPNLTKISGRLNGNASGINGDAAFFG